MELLRGFGRGHEGYSSLGNNLEGDAGVYIRDASLDPRGPLMGREELSHKTALPKTGNHGRPPRWPMWVRGPVERWMYVGQPWRVWNPGQCVGSRIKQSRNIDGNGIEFVVSRMAAGTQQMYAGILV